MNSISDDLGDPTTHQKSFPAEVREEQVSPTRNPQRSLPLFFFVPSFQVSFFFDLKTPKGRKAKMLKKRTMKHPSLPFSTAFQVFSRDSALRISIFRKFSSFFEV